MSQQARDAEEHNRFLGHPWENGWLQIEGGQVELEDISSNSSLRRELIKNIFTFGAFWILGVTVHAPQSALFYF